MKKIMYILFGALLFLPFVVNAEVVDPETYFGSVPNIVCDGDIMTDGELNCSFSINKKTDKSVRFDINLPEGSPFAVDPTQISVDFSSGTGTGSLKFTPPSDIAFVPTDTVQKYSVDVYEDNEKVTTFNSSFPVNASSLPEDNPTPQTNSNKTNSSTGNNKTTTTRSTSKGVTNPNTADQNVLMLSIVSLLLMFIIVVTLKKVKVIKR